MASRSLVTGAPGAFDGAGRTRVSRFLRNRSITPLYFLLPTIVPLAVLTLYPVLRGIWLAFTRYDDYRKDSSFVGLANFTALATSDTLFWGALWRTVIWTVGIVVVTYVVGLLTALALNESIVGRGFLRALVLVPWVCPAVVAALVWSWIYDPNFGPLNYALRQLHLVNHNVGWLSDSGTALVATMAVAVWKLLPFTVVMLLAGLQAVPKELYEAASVDGGGTLARFRDVTLPLLGRVGSIAFLLSVIWAFNHFDTVYVLTGGGPGDATMILPVLVYQQAFKFFQIGYASAIGVVMLLVLIVPMTLYVRQVLKDLA